MEDKLKEKFERWFHLYTRTAKTRNEKMLYNEMNKTIQEQAKEIELLEEQSEGMAEKHAEKDIAIQNMNREIERLRTIEQTYQALRKSL